MPEARVLIVDDINTNLRVASGLMQPYNMQIDICSSGMDAIEAVKSNRYDIIFMDHMMPEMNGIEATSLIRALDGDTSYFKNVPIIALTANAIHGVREMFLENGFNDFLSKPIDTGILNTILEEWIPKEKQLKPTKKIFAVNEQDSGETIKIAGIDTDRGILLSGGTIDGYLQTLTLFCDDSRNKLKEIVTCLKNEDLSLYTTYVHAMKSACANIGALELSKTAESLEMAGQKKDMSFILASNNTFTSDLEKLLGAIDEHLSARNNKNQSKSIDIELLKAELEKLRAGLIDYDIVSANEACESLQEFTQAADIGDTVLKILQHELTGKYDEAVLLINALLVGIKVSE